jgi:hypothetical protein
MAESELAALRDLERRLRRIYQARVDAIAHSLVLNV